MYWPLAKAALAEAMERPSLMRGTVKRSWARKEEEAEEEPEEAAAAAAAAAAAEAAPTLHLSSSSRV